LHARRWQHGELVLITAGDQVIDQALVLVEPRVCLRDHEASLLNRRQIIDLIGNHAIDHLAVRRLQETVRIGAGVDGQRVDQADVGTFRRLDRAYAAIMRGMHVTHLEASALAGQATRTQGGDTPLVRHFRQRIVLIHEL